MLGGKRLSSGHLHPGARSVMTTATPDPLQRLIRALTATRIVSRLLSRSLNRLDLAVLALSGGRQTATGGLGGIPVLTVETLGARSGRPHRVTLLAIPRGSEYVLIATAFGSPRHPDWYHNLVAHPDVLLTVDRVTRRYRARETQGYERQACWDLAVSVYPGYADYLERAQRPIPVLLLAPADGSSSDACAGRGVEPGS
jgi:deazaflavin-dependent oxidoreductase (nitroreductase family)